MKREHARLATISALLGMSVQAACSVPLSERVVQINNRCDADSECGALGRCIENTCVATDADLGDLVLEVEVPSTSPFAPSTTHVVRPSARETPLSGEATYFKFFDIDLAEFIEVTVSLQVNNIPSECGGLADAMGRVPIRVELSMVRAEDAPVPPGVATRVYDASTPAGAEDNEVKINVPLAGYDIYITPLIPEKPEDPDAPYAFDGCILPPRLLRDANISDGEERAVVTYDEANPGHSGTMQGYDLQDWTIALLENKKGRLVSNVEKLSLSQGDTRWTLRSWEESSEDLVLRLTPPETLAVDLGMPVFYWVLAQLPDNDATVESLQGVDPIDITGGVIDENFDFVPSTITIHSEEIDIGFGPNVVYRRTIETDPDGGFSGFKLLPGTYTFSIQPAFGEDLAVTHQTETFSQGNQGSGKSLTVKRKLPLNGTAATVQGEAAALVNAVLEPTIPEAGTYLQSLTRSLPVLPRSAATVTTEAGAFSVLVDRGTFNFSLRPEPDSGLPWTVLSSFRIEASQEQLDDVALEIPNPVLLLGQVNPSLPIPNARIRAWIRPRQLNTEIENAEPAAVQIGEAISDAQGVYRLYLPGSLATISQ